MTPDTPDTPDTDVALAQELRRMARRCADEAWLLERAIDGALALKILEEAPDRIGIRQSRERLALGFTKGTDGV